MIPRADRAAEFISPMWPDLWWITRGWPGAMASSCSKVGFARPGIRLLS